MKSYKAEELFDANGKFIDELAALSPVGNRRMEATPCEWRRELITLALPISPTMRLRSRACQVLARRRASLAISSATSSE